MPTPREDNATPNPSVLFDSILLILKRSPNNSSSGGTSAFRTMSTNTSRLTGLCLLEPRMARPERKSVTEHYLDSLSGGQRKRGVHDHDDPFQRRDYEGNRGACRA